MTLRLLRAAARPYRSESLGVRAHVAFRWISCPFDRVLAAVGSVPPGGRVLDFGCGHGVLTNRLAAALPHAHLVGVDIDADKIRVASRVAERGTTFVTVAPGEVPEGPWDAITVVDVLYLLRDPGRGHLLAALAASLAPGGRLVVKEMSDEPSPKARWMRFQERIAVHVARVTKGEGLAFTDAALLVERLRTLGLAVSDERVDRRYPYPHHLVVGRRSGEEVPTDEVGVHEHQRGGTGDKDC